MLLKVTNKTPETIFSFAFRNCILTVNPHHSPTGNRQLIIQESMERGRRVGVMPGLLDTQSRWFF